MINAHQHIEFIPHCFLCGEKIDNEDTAISIRGHFGSSGDRGCTIWFHAEPCADRIEHILFVDTNAVRQLKKNTLNGDRRDSNERNREVSVA